MGDDLGRRDDAGPRRRRRSRSRRRDRPARRSATCSAHAADWGARTIEVGSRAARPGLRPPPAAGRRRRGPRPAVGASRRSRSSRSRSPAHAAPIRTGPTGSSGTTARDSGTSWVPERRCRRDPDRPRRCGQRGVHAQPAGRHPQLPGAARRRDRPPRHRRRPARDRRADGRLDRRGAGRDTDDPRQPRPPRGAARRRLRDRHDPGRRRAGDRRSTSTSPRRYGLQYTINDTINVGGVLRGLRTIPVVLGIVSDMADVCPDAPFLNYTNPMGMLVRAVDEADGFPTVGLCHSVYWTVDRLADYLGRPGRRGRRALGRRQPPRLAPAARAPRPRPVPGPPGVRRRGPRPRRRPRPGRPLSGGSASTPRSRRSTTPSTTRGSSRRARSSRSTSRSASTSRGSRTTSTSSRRRSAGSTPASRSRSSGAASTRR